MKFGEVYSFTYLKKRARDKSPSVVFLEKNGEKIFGLNLNYIHPTLRDPVMELVNSEIFRSFSFDEDLVETALERGKGISDRNYARMLIMNNSSSLKKELSKMNYKKSKNRLLSIMTEAFRVYDAESMKDVEKVEY